MQFVHLVARSAIAERKWNAPACKPTASFCKTLSPLTYNNDAHDRQLTVRSSHTSPTAQLCVSAAANCWHRQRLVTTVVFGVFCLVLLLEVVGNCCCRLTSQPAITRISWNFNFAMFCFIDGCGIYSCRLLPLMTLDYSLVDCCVQFVGAVVVVVCSVTIKRIVEKCEI